MPNAPRPNRRRLIALGLLAGAVLLGSAPARAQPGTVEKRIFVVPPMQWDSGMGTFKSGYTQTARDLASLTDGIIFGLKPPEVNAMLPDPMPEVTWRTMPMATEYPEEVKYFWVRIGTGKALDAGITSCVGDGSYIVFLFRARGLFRMSYRLFSDPSCPSVADAAASVLSHYVGMDPTVALAMHYRNGDAEVVDIVDPAAGYLIPLRWLQRRR